MLELKDGSVYPHDGGRRIAAVLHITDDLGNKRPKVVYGRDRDEAIANREAEKERLVGARRAWQDTDLLVDVIAYVLSEHLPSRPSQERLAGSTIKGYAINFRLHLRPLLTRVRLRDVDGLTFTHVKDTLAAEGLDPQTIGISFIVMRKALEYACEQGVLKVNVGRAQPQPRKRRPSGKRVTVTTPEVEMAKRLGRMLEARATEAADACLVIMATGMRINEALAMTAADLELARARAAVTGDPLEWRVDANIQWGEKAEDDVRQPWDVGDTKNHEPRMTPLCDFALPALERCLVRQAAKRLPKRGCLACRRVLVGVPRGPVHTYTHLNEPADGHEPVPGPERAHRWEEHDLLFSTRWGTPLREKQVADLLREVSRELGLKEGENHLTPHALRYAFATLMWETEEVAMEDIQKWMGHKDSKITRGLYVKATRTKRLRAARALNDLLAG